MESSSRLLISYVGTAVVHVYSAKEDRQSVIFNVRLRSRRFNVLRAILPLKTTLVLDPSLTLRRSLCAKRQCAGTPLRAPRGTSFPNRYAIP